VIYLPLRFRDRGRVFATDRAVDSVAITNSAMRDAGIRAATHPPAERGPGAWPGPFAASCRSCRIVVSLNGRFFSTGVRRICGITIRGRAAQFELLTAVEACAARRLVLVRLNVGVQAHRAVLIDRRRGVLRAERIVDDLLEATGGWSEQVAISLGEAGHIISIVNPARIKAFAQSEMVRTKRTGSMQLSSRVLLASSARAVDASCARNTHSARPCAPPTQPYPDAS